MRPNLTARAVRRGSALLETALTFPFVILLVIVVLDYGLFVLSRHLITNLVRDGARHAIVSTRRDAGLQAQLKDRLSQYLPGNMAADSVEIYKTDSSGAKIVGTGGSWTTAHFGDSIAVEGKATYKPILPAMVLFDGTVVTFFPTTRAQDGSLGTPIGAKCIMSSEFD